MIKYISSWAEQIIIAVIFVTILEIILPKGNSKKYIKTILGVYILYIIISPAITLITGKKLEVDYSKYEKYFNTEETMANIQTPTVEDTYKTELNKQIKEDVENLGYSVNKVDSDIDLKEGKISKVILTISKEKKQENNINIEINQIEIGNISTEDENTKEAKQIKQMIKENYGVDKQNIIVNSK